MGKTEETIFRGGRPDQKLQLGQERESFWDHVTGDMDSTARTRFRRNGTELVTVAYVVRSYDRQDL